MSSARLSFNIPGSFYTLDRCEGCGQCIRFAPNHVAFDQSEVFCYVYRQPATQAEIACIRKAVELCPANALHEGNDSSHERVY
ncbi:MAG TPA: ferredoxin [Bacteroidota bacterium]|nr:ferredoxin [Bacteroidota bacterium]